MVTSRIPFSGHLIRGSNKDTEWQLAAIGGQNEASKGGFPALVCHTESDFSGPSDHSHVQ